MNRLIFCTKLKKEAEGLANPPFSTELGSKIYHQISKEAWSLWLKQQTILINENKLNLTDSSARSFLMVEMERFLFEEN